MVHSAVHTLSVLFALVGGTAAGLLALLFRRVTADSPFGTAVAFLSAATAGMVLYHVVLFLSAADSPLLDALRSALYTALAAFVWLSIATHHRLEHTASGSDGP